MNETPSSLPPIVIHDRYGWALIWPSGYRSAMPDESSARTCLASPSLLAACKEFVDWSRSISDLSLLPEILRRTVAAIALAEGGGA